MNRLRRRPQEEKREARPELDGRVITATVERAQAHLKHMPLAGSRPLHNDESLCLFKVKQAINEFFSREG